MTLSLPGDPAGTEDMMAIWWSNQRNRRREGQKRAAVDEGGISEEQVGRPYKRRRKVSLRCTVACLSEAHRQLLVTVGNSQPDPLLVCQARLFFTTLQLPLPSFIIIFLLLPSSSYHSD